MRSFNWALPLLLAAAACDDAPKDQPTDPATPMAEETATAALETSDDATEAPPAETRRAEYVVNESYEFKYAYPAAAGAIAGLKSYLDADLEKSRSTLMDGARRDQTAAKKSGYPYHAHSFMEEWKVVADIPAWLSISSQFYTFTGGAHGMSGFDTLLWDRHAEAVRRPLDLFVSTDAFSKALRAPFCDVLNKDRAKKRGAPVGPASDEMFSDCIDPVEQVLILGSSNGQTFNRIGILVAPYNAGPYAEGSYEVTLPVTAAVMAALKPQYRASFSLGK